VARTASEETSISVTIIPIVNPFLPVTLMVGDAFFGFSFITLTPVFCSVPVWEKGIHKLILGKGCIFR
jgi:hypothetical protein